MAWLPATSYPAKYGQPIQPGQNDGDNETIQIPSSSLSIVAAMTLKSSTIFLTITVGEPTTDDPPYSRSKSSNRSAARSGFQVCLDRNPSTPSTVRSDDASDRRPLLHHLFRLASSSDSDDMPFLFPSSTDDEQQQQQQHSASVPFQIRHLFRVR
ncbi:hypothetical protein ACLOJK_023114 [Asimina triloba]